jgi:eukaryotic-like serine/threonine-protein kinase
MSERVFSVNHSPVTAVAQWKVPGYTELRMLGSGGFGEVVLARDDASGALVAVKYLRRELLADPEFAAMFRAEAKVLALMDDPNVVRLYEYVESASGAAIVMELVDGVSVREIVSAQGKTSAEAALVVLQGSLLGLAAAHARGVVHRDYKPENVLVDRAGVSKLTDFGIAARAGDRAIAAGTLAYAPPEQFSGGPASPAGDVYAATATFYECLTGYPPFRGDTPEALLYQHLTVPVPLEPVPAPLRPLVTAGMAKDPAARPADAAAFVTELRAAAWPAYGEDWEDRGRSHLGEAALLLAALWPSGAAPAAAGHATEQVHLSQGPRAPQAPGHTGNPDHLRHLEHAQHAEHLEHVEHAEHLEHAHAEHVEHLEHLGRSAAGHSGHGIQAAGGAKSAAGTAGAAGEGAGSAAGVAGAAAAAGATPPPPSPTPPSPPVTPLQRVVRNASQSHRLPRRLRHAIPRDPSAGMATAIVAGATAAAVVIVAVIAVIASALTSGNPTPQTGSASTGPAAIGAAASSASGTSQASTSCGGLLTAWAALPLTTASFTASVQQEIATCTGHVVSVSCSNTYGNSVDYDYTCTIPPQEAQELSMYSTSDFQASPATGNWAFDGVGQN